MTVPQPSESARLAQLEQRVQVLEDVNAIRHLKARYAAYCDDGYLCPTPASVKSAASGDTSRTETPYTCKEAMSG